MPSGFEATTKDNVVLNVALLLVGGAIVGGAATGDKFGLSKGGIDFDPGRKDRHIEFDGLRAPIAGLEYPIDYDSHLKGKIVVAGSAQLGYLEPGAGSETVGQVTTYTPKATGTLYDADSDYLADVMAVATMGDGGLFVVKFAVARVIKWKLDSKDKQEMELEFDLQAFLDADAAATSTDGCPYEILRVAPA